MAWYDDLPDELKEAPIVKEAPDLATFAKTSIDNQAFLGRSIRIPSEDAGEEAVKEFHEKLMNKVPGLVPIPVDGDEEAFRAIQQKLGMPEEADAYELPDLDEKIPMPEGLDSAMKEWAHELGMTKSQLKGFVDKWQGFQGDIIGKMLHDVEEGMNALKQEWGAAYDKKMAVANKVIDESFPFLKTSPGGINADMLKAAADLGERMYSEDPQIGKQDGAGSREAMTPAEAQMRLAEIRNDRDGPYWNPSHPAHEATKKRVEELTLLAHPGMTNDPNALRA